MQKSKFPRFPQYACVGDYITWEKSGFEITAALHADIMTSPANEDYSPIKIKHWKNDEWFFVGVVLSVHKNGILIDKHAASLWGIECNYHKRSNRHLSEVAQDLESEAIDAARKQVSKMLGALQ